MTVCTHGNFIVCPTGKPGCQHHDLIFYSSHHHHNLISYSVTLSWYWANQPLPYPNNAKHLARKQHVSILKSLVWLNRVWTGEVQITRSPKTGDGRSTHLVIRSGLANIEGIAGRDKVCKHARSQLQSLFGNHRTATEETFIDLFVHCLIDLFVVVSQPSNI